MAALIFVGIIVLIIARASDDQMSVRWEKANAISRTRGKDFIDFVFSRKFLVMAGSHAVGINLWF
ncbi:MAG: hypothetical protein OIF56_04575 [Cohaesibacter sp.]|nr:hypothetical protein [Cohaesibacter sp.]MCV6602081.1 hypothetical protein [Cohaesibacter sp.]